jgi:heme-degrading monooxygenase HmoA
MITELGMLQINEGSEAEFEKAMLRAPELFGRAHGFRSFTVKRCVEEPSRYLLLVEWDTLEDHTEGFRESPLLQEWRDLASGFVAGRGDQLHFRSVGPGGSDL